MRVIPGTNSETETVSDSLHGSARSSSAIADLFARALWRGRWSLVLGVVAGTIVGGLVARSMQPIYEAAATLLITESRDPEAVNSPETVSAIANSNAMATRVLGSLQLDRPPYSLTSDTFRANHVAIEPLRGSRMVRVKVTLPDAALAARGADEVARQTVELARNLNQQDTAFLRDYLGAQLQAAQTRKEQLQQQMVAYRTSSQLELVETDADGLLQQRSHLSKLVIDIAAEETRLATAERELATQERILKAPRHPQIEGALMALSDNEQRRATRPDSGSSPPRVGTSQSATFRAGVPEIEIPQNGTLPNGTAQNGTRQNRNPIPQNAPPQNAPPQAAIQRYEQSDEKQIRRPATAQPDSAASETPLSIPPEAIDDFVNPVYEILDYQAATGRTRLAALQKERDELIRVGNVNARQLQTLSTMYRTQIELRKLQTEYDLAEKIYLDLSMKYEQARVQAVSRSSHVQVLDSAVQPTQPVAPRKRRIVAAGAVSGLLLALAGLILAAALGSRRGNR